ncbi:MAG: hypothetical protein U0575_12195 [Phycisphaerales bacterium]
MVRVSLVGAAGGTGVMSHATGLRDRPRVFPTVGKDDYTRAGAEVQGVHWSGGGAPRLAS